MMMKRVPGYVAVAIVTLLSGAFEAASAQAPMFSPEPIPVIDPMVALVSQAAESTGPDLGQVALDCTQCRSRGRLLAAVLASSVGSAAGLYAGIETGWAINGDKAYREDHFAPIVGGAFGSWVGAATGSVVVNRKIGRSLLGSTAGMVLGALFASATDDDGIGGVLIFSLIHGAVTAGVGY